MSQFDNVSVVKKANVYFDGKCVSHTVMLADGTKKTVGVIMPSSLTFNTGAPEIMEGVGGSCRVRLKGESEWKTYGDGQSFNEPGNSSGNIRVGRGCARRAKFWSRAVFPTPVSASITASSPGTSGRTARPRLGSQRVNATAFFSDCAANFW